jgi:hypothetical protein
MMGRWLLVPALLVFGVWTLTASGACVVWDPPIGTILMPLIERIPIVVHDRTSISMSPNGRWQINLTEREAFLSSSLDGLEVDHWQGWGPFRVLVRRGIMAVGGRVEQIQWLGADHVAIAMMDCVQRLNNVPVGLTIDVSFDSTGLACPDS